MTTRFGIGGLSTLSPRDSAAWASSPSQVFPLTVFSSCSLSRRQSVCGMILRRSARYYMSPERNAVLAIVAKRGAWHIADHVAAEPSHDQGKALRERLIGPLTIAADRAGVEIRTVAANQKLADQYVAEVQGLVDVGPGMPRGRKLQRPPAQDARTNLQ